MTRERTMTSGHEHLTTLEHVLRLHGLFRQSREPLRVTPFQVAVLLFLHRYPRAKVTDAADALVVRVPTVSEVLNDLVRNRWVTKRYSVEDRRVVCVQLSRRGEALVRKIWDSCRHEGNLTAKTEA